MQPGDLGAAWTGVSRRCGPRQQRRTHGRHACVRLASLPFLHPTRACVLSAIRPPACRRAWPGGAGDCKIGGNYAPTIMPQVEQEAGDQSEWKWMGADGFDCGRAAARQAVVHHLAGVNTRVAAPVALAQSRVLTHAMSARSGRWRRRSGMACLRWSTPSRRRRRWGGWWGRGPPPAACHLPLQGCGSGLARAPPNPNPNPPAPNLTLLLQ